MAGLVEGQLQALALALTMNVHVDEVFCLQVCCLDQITLKVRTTVCDTGLLPRSNAHTIAVASDQKLRLCSLLL